MKTWRVCVLMLAGLAMGTAIALHTSADNPAKAGDVTEGRITSEMAAANNWLLNGRTFDSKHFSPLQQITDKNIGGLGLAWSLDIESGMGVVSEPIVVDGVIYVSAPLSIVYAVDAVSGKVIWKFDPKIRLNQAINGSYSARVNAGVAVWNGKVYVGTGDCRLIAIDAATAKQVWEAEVCEPTQTGITGAPHVARGKILMGYNGSDDGVRGALVAYDAETGKEAWRFWTVPGDPSKPFETKALEMAAKSWGGKDSWKVGGGDVWNAITYDDATGLVILGTAGVGVDYGEFRNIKATGDRLFGECIIAVNADTGEYVWHYQTGTDGIHS
jgi:quinohemoprotein ethanol dehydrogenase